MIEELVHIRREMVFALWDAKDAIWMPENPQNTEGAQEKYEAAIKKFLDLRKKALMYGAEPFKGFSKLTEPLADKVCARLRNYQAKFVKP